MNESAHKIQSALFDNCHARRQTKYPMYCQIFSMPVTGLSHMVSLILKCNALLSSQG